MSSATCARNGGAVLWAVYRLHEGRGEVLRNALKLQQYEQDLLAQNVEPARANFLARIKLSKEQVR